MNDKKRDHLKQQSVKRLARAIEAEWPELDEVKYTKAKRLFDSMEIEVMRRGNSPVKLRASNPGERIKIPLVAANLGRPSRLLGAMETFDLRPVLEGMTPEEASDLLAGALLGEDSEYRRALAYSLLINLRYELPVATQRIPGLRSPHSDGILNGIYKSMNYSMGTGYYDLDGRNKLDDDAEDKMRLIRPLENGVTTIYSGSIMGMHSYLKQEKLTTQSGVHPAGPTHWLGEFISTIYPDRLVSKTPMHGEEMMEALDELDDPRGAIVLCREEPWTLQYQDWESQRFIFTPFHSEDGFYSDVIDRYPSES